MATEIFTRQNFDPRKHSAVAITVSDKQPFYTGHTRGEELPLKNYMVGPNVPPAGLSLRRPITAPVTRRFADGRLDPQPKILNQNGKWVQEEIPSLIAESQAQPLTSTSTFTATLPGSAAQRALRPMTAVHTYNDVSPVCAADMVHDTDMEVTMVKDSTIGRPQSAVSGQLKASLAAASAPQVSSILSRTGKSGARGTNVDTPDVRRQSIGSFWARQAGTTFNLGISDLDRVEELGRNVPPGSCNTRLIGSRWRYIQRPVEGDVIYTDYYGRCGEKLDDYYGRQYHVTASQFNKNRLVDDLDYIKEQASMQGIHTLRTRPGLVLDSTIVNAAPERFQTLTASEAKTAKGVHKMNEYARMRPASERQLRAVWNDSTRM